MSFLTNFVTMKFVITIENEKAVCRIKPKELIEFEGCTFADVLDNLAEVESDSVNFPCVS